MNQKKKRRSLDFRSLDSIVEDANRLQQSSYERLGSWSLGQCCNHLAIAMEMSMDGFPIRMPFPFTLLPRWMFYKTRWGANLMANMRVPTFPQMAQKQPVEDQVGIDRLTNAIARFSDERTTLKAHPLFGKISRQQWVEFHLFHSNRHLSFLIPTIADLNRTVEERSSTATA